MDKHLIVFFLSLAYLWFSILLTFCFFFLILSWFNNCWSCKGQIIELHIKEFRDFWYCLLYWTVSLINKLRLRWVPWFPLISNSTYKLTPIYFLIWVLGINSGPCSTFWSSWQIPTAFLFAASLLNCRKEWIIQHMVPVIIARRKWFIKVIKWFRSSDK